MHTKQLRVYYCLLSFFLFNIVCAGLAEVRYQKKIGDHNQQEIFITIPLDQEELLYADTVTFETDHPGFHVTDVHIPQSAISMYDSASKQTKRVYQPPAASFRVTVSNNTEKIPHEAYLHVIYTSNHTPLHQEKLIPLIVQNREKTESENSTLETKTTTHTQRTKKQPSQSISHYISMLLKSSNSRTLQLILALILGMLLSLTPCIYPMIPITVGILHSYGTTSFLGNTLRAIVYTMGIATTYALFGLVASCTGPLCGQLLADPIFVYLLVLFLAYLAGSMLGIYELYIPRFMQLQPQTVESRSLWSVFLFGVMSGSIASPCVSPGLALILSVAATIGNKVVGFLLLFAFGVGLGMPLLLVGTFSSSLTLLPRAGLWMIEIKKVFGFLLLGLCLYYLSNILAWNIILFISAVILMISGILYIVWAQKMPTQLWKKGYNLLGTIVVGISVLIFMYAIQETFYPYKLEESTVWLHDMDEALTIAKKSNKLIFVDFWAKFCSVCIAINNSILADEDVLRTFNHHYVLVKIDGTSAKSEPYVTLQKEYGITGFPTFLVIDANTKKILKKWDSKIYTMPKEKFIKKITKIASMNTI